MAKARLVDMHMHAGFVQDPRSFARELEHAGVVLCANSVTPKEYLRLREEISDCENVRICCGIHPWWVSEEKGQFEEFREALGDCAYVGEVGLDFHPKHDATRKSQRYVFERIVKLCAQRGGYVISTHSVRAERELLDILESAGCTKNCTCILHSYGGPSDQLKRAVEAGCLFSIGLRMLSTKRGREYARILPQERIFLETDLPSNAENPIEAMQLSSTLEEVLRELSIIRSCSLLELSACVLEQSLQALALV